VTAARSRFDSLSGLAPSIAWVALLAALATGVPPPAGAQALAPPLALTPPIERPAKSLAVRVSPWSFPSRPLAITIDQHGVLAGRHLAIYVFVDGNQIDRVTTKSDRTHARIPVEGLTAGQHLLAVRSGSEAAEVRFRVLSWSRVVGGGLVLAAVLAAALLGFRFARRAAAPAN
jgi:hypothetical protein